MEAHNKFIKAAPLIPSDDSHTHSFLINPDPFANLVKHTLRHGEAMRNSLELVLQLNVVQ